MEWRGRLRSGSVLGFVLLSACSPEGSAPPIGTAQLAVESAPLIGPALQATEPAAADDARFWSDKAGAAWNGSAYLLVAQSEAWPRDDADANFVADSVAWRLDENANALDQLPFGVPGAGSVASNGSDWLIAWGKPGGVFATRVSADGVVLDPTGFLVGTAGSAGRVEAASDGQNYLVVWDDNGVLHGARLGPSSTVLGTTSIAAGNAQFPVVAWAGTHYLVAYDTVSGPILATRVDSNGTVLDASAIVIGEGTAPEIASSGTESLIVRDGTYVYGTRVSADGTVLDPSPLNVAYEASDPMSPKVTWDGGSYLVYTDSDCFSSHTILHRVTKSGDVSSASAGVCLAHSTNMAVAGAGSGKHLRAFLDFEDILPIVVAAAPSGDWIATSAQPQHDPRITVNDSGALVAWREPYLKKHSISIGNRLRAARVDRPGNSLDPEGLRIPPELDVMDREWDLIDIDRFDLAAGRSSFLVVSDEGGHLVTASVPTTGPLPESGGIERDGPLGGVFSDGTSYLATWTEHTLVGPEKRLAWQFDESGAPLTAAPTELPVTIQPSDGVWNGSSYLVVWATGQIQAVRLSSSGKPIGSPVSIAPGECPAVAWDGRNHLLVWSIEGAIRGARVTRLGAVADPGGFAIASGGCPRVAYDGVHYVVVFADGLQPAVGAARVTPEGAVVDSPPLIIEPMGAEPDVASFRDGRALVAYRRESPIQGTKASRVWVREMTEVCECEAGPCEGPACVRELPSDDPDDSGCACSIPGSGQRAASPWLLAGLLAMTRRARKQRTTTSARSGV